MEKQTRMKKFPDGSGAVVETNPYNVSDDALRKKMLAKAQDMAALPEYVKIAVDELVKCRVVKLFTTQFGRSASLELDNGEIQNISLTTKLFEQFQLEQVQVGDQIAILRLPNIETRSGFSLENYVVTQQ